MNNMKHLFFPLFAAGLLLASCGEAPQDTTPTTSSQTEGSAYNTSVPDGNYVVNKVKPKVTWAASKLTGGGHNGTLYIEDGKFKIVDGQIAEGIVIFDMARIEVADLSGEDKARLEDHLRSGDFFNVETHPKAILNVNKVYEARGGVQLDATLTMNGEAVDYTIPMQVMPADIPGEVKGLALQGKFLLDRTKHNITYRSQTFNDKLDWFIKDGVELGFSIMGTPSF